MIIIVIIVGDKLSHAGLLGWLKRWGSVVKPCKPPSKWKNVITRAVLTLPASSIFQHSIITTLPHLSWLSTFVHRRQVFWWCISINDILGMSLHCQSCLSAQKMWSWNIVCNSNCCCKIATSRATTEKEISSILGKMQGGKVCTCTSAGVRFSGIWSGYWWIVVI